MTLKLMSSRSLNFPTEMWLLMFVDFEAKKFPPEDWITKNADIIS